jgi:FkbM family methyltransferase
MFKILYLIFSHPLNKANRLKAIWRFLVWQIVSRVYKHPILLPFTNKSSYLCWNGLTGLTGNYYYGLMEMEEMSFLLHFLKDEDCFFDIGANVGAFSILAIQHSKANIHIFEPHPQSFKYLSRNIFIQDRKENVSLYNLALGDFHGRVSFTSDLDTVNHVATPEEKNLISVEMTTLNSLKLPSPTIIKIDVEGFELNVLNGATEIFEGDTLLVVIIELNGSGDRYGISDKDIDTFLKNYGFYPFTYNPFVRRLIELENYTSHNTIYIRNKELISNRLVNSSSFVLSNGCEL